MPKKCPNQSHPDWKLMVNLLGEDMAWELYDNNNQEVPARDMIFEEYNKNDVIEKAIPQNITEEMMEPSSPVGKLIFDRLQSKYPTIQIFNDKQKFVDFVKQNGGDTNEIDWNTIGDAFYNAVYINPNEPVQEILFHEYAHIYWDSLSDSNPVKKQLRELYKDTGATPGEIDENIVTDIGAAGIDLATSLLPKSLIQKFNDLLKKFWIEVKKVFGKYDDINLVNHMAEAIWNNLDNITDADFTKSVVHHMSKQDELRYDDKGHVVRLGNKILQTISSAVNAISGDPFNPDGAANKIFDRILTQKKEIIKKRLAELKEIKLYTVDTDEKQRLSRIIKNLEERTPEDPSVRNRVVSILKRRWEKQNSINLAIQAIIDGIVKKTARETVSDRVINNNGEKVSDLIPEETHNALKERINKFIKAQEEKGWKVKSDVLIGSKRYMVSGHASIVLVKDDKAVIVDLRPVYKNDEINNNKKIAKYFKSPVSGIEDTLENKWKYQVGLYANIFEEQNDIDVVQTKIFPIYYDMNQGQAIDLDFEKGEKFSYDRHRRGTKVKDRYRENSAKILNHALLMQKIRTAKTLNEDLIEKLNKKFGYDKNLLREVNIAMDILSMHSGEQLAKISEAYIANLFGIGLETMGDTLIDKLGFEREDIVGDKEQDIEPMSAKEIIVRFRNDIKKGEEWESEPIEDIDTFKKRVLTKTNVEDFGVRSEEEAFERYKAELKMVDSIYARIKNIHGIGRLNTDTIKKYHRGILNYGSEEAVGLRLFLEELMLSKFLTERIRYENQQKDLYNKTGTRLAYKMLINPNSLFQDFTTLIGKAENLTRTMKNVGPEHMVIQLLNQEMISSHHNIISKTVTARETLESFVKDEYYDADKPKSEKKKLSDSDFQDVITTKRNGSIKYLMTAEAARAKLQKKYGKDDPRPKNMAGYISYLTNEMAEYDWFVKQAMMEYREEPQLMLPEAYISQEELFSMLNGTNKWFSIGLHAYLAPSAVDGKNIYIDGEQITFLDYKRRLASEIIEKNNNNESIADLVEKAKKARKIALIGEKKKGQKIQKKNVVGGKQIGRAVITSNNHNASIQENVASLISARERENLIPLGEYVKSKYKGKVIATDYLDKLVSKHIYQNLDVGRIKINWLNSAVKYIFAIAAKKGLAFNVKSNLANRFFGIAGNWVMHPQTMLHSYERKINALKNRTPLALARQISGMMEHSRIGTIMQDFRFSKYKKLLEKSNDLAFAPLKFAEFFNQGELFLGLLTDKEIEAYNKNGKPLLVDSKGNIFDPDSKPVGMTFKQSQEWEAKIRNSKQHPDALSKERINYIETRLNEVHGYFGFNKPAWSYYELGQWIGLYRLSWMQSIFNMWNMSRRSDITGVERVGIVRSYSIVAKSIMFNYLRSYKNKAIKNVRDKIESNSYESDDNRGTAFEKARKKLLSQNKFARTKEGEDIIYEGQRADGKHYYRINGLDYDFSDFENIVQKKMEENKDEITIFGEDKDVSRVDINNLVRGVILMTIYGLVYELTKAVGDWDDDLIYGEEQKINGKKIRPLNRRRAIYELTRKERLLHYTYQFLSGMGENITDDLILPTNPEKLLELVKDPLVPVRLLEDIIDYIGNFGKSLFGMEGAKYATPTPQNRYDATKWIYNWADITVYDNLVNSARTLKRIVFDDPYYESLEKIWDSNRAKILQEYQTNVYMQGKQEGKSDKEIKEDIKNITEQVNVFLNDPKYKEAFVLEILMDVKERQMKFDSEDKQIQLMIDMINKQSAAKKYYKQEVKKEKDSDIGKPAIKEAGEKIKKQFEKE